MSHLSSTIKIQILFHFKLFWNHCQRGRILLPNKKEYEKDHFEVVLTYFFSKLGNFRHLDLDLYPEYGRGIRIQQLKQIRILYGSATRKEHAIYMYCRTYGKEPEDTTIVNCAEWKRACRHTLYWPAKRARPEDMGLRKEEKNDNSCIEQEKSILGEFLENLILRHKIYCRLQKVPKDQ